MTNNETDTFDFEACSRQAYELLREDTNKEWCNFEMDGSCAFAGIYQPPLPKVNADIDEFIATSNFVDVFQFLNLGEKAAVSEIGAAAEHMCGKSLQELKESNPERSDLEQYCFRSIFIYHLLRNGWKFGDDYVMTALDVIDGQKLGWALGCMLYEINILPFEFHPELLYKGIPWWLVTTYVILGTLVGGVVGFTIAMRSSKKFNKVVRESKFFRNTLGKSDIIRKSLALPSLKEDLSDLDYLYAQDDTQGAKESVPLFAASGRGGNGTKYS
jgi:hypothetical protein